MNRRILIQYITAAFILLLFVRCKNEKVYDTQILVAGGSVSGTAAAIQAARSGVNVLLIEETNWLGGMLTAAGVSATDGNHKLPSGLWNEFRQKLYAHYGGPEKLATGWVSNTQFEPWVGDSILKSMVAEYKNITILYGFHIKEVLVENKKVKSAIFENENKESIKVNFKIAIDATELGDFMAKSGVEYSLGQESNKETGESIAPDYATKYIQDLTYVAILKDFGKTPAPKIKLTEEYDFSKFDGTCKQLSSDTTIELWDCSKMMTYGKLPNNYYMINWPIKGNDTYLNVVEMDFFQRKQAYKKAKETTLAYIYHLQTVGGFSNLGLADKFGTEDKLALIPYHREGRRVKGVIQLNLNDLQNTYGDKNREFYKQAISCGDYPLDHHHEKNHEVKKEVFPRIPSYSIPFGALIPEKIDGLIVAEKGISVTHIVNGTTRLQPVVMLTGQAAGEIAALSIKNNTEPRNTNIRELQESLLSSNCMLLPYNDVTPEKEYFQAVQKIALIGWMRGKFVSEGWANRAYFYPDSTLNNDTLEIILKRISDKEIIIEKQGTITKLAALKYILPLWKANEYKDTNTLIEIYTSNNIISEKWAEKIEEPITRAELAVLLNNCFKPFEKEFKL